MLYSKGKRDSGRDLLQRVHAAPYTGTPFADDDPFDAEVTITLADGRSYTEKVDRPLGRTSDNAIAHQHMTAKFENCAARVLAPAAVAAACRALEALEKLGSTCGRRHALRLQLGRGSAEDHRHSGGRGEEHRLGQQHRR